MHVVLELEPDAVLRLPRAAGLEIECLEGALWITQDNDTADIVLAKGDSYRMARRRALVQAVHRSRISIRCNAILPVRPSKSNWALELTAA